MKRAGILMVSALFAESLARARFFLTNSCLFWLILAYSGDLWLIPANSGLF